MISPLTGRGLPEPHRFLQKFFLCRFWSSAFVYLYVQMFSAPFDVIFVVVVKLTNPPYIYPLGPNSHIAQCMVLF